MMRFMLLVAAIGVAAFSPAQEPSAQKSGQSGLPWVLRKAIENGPKLRYVARRTIEFRKDGQKHTYSEIVTRDGPNLRIEFPNGSPYAGQIIVETSRERRHYFPDMNEIRIVAPRREEAYQRLSKLGKSNGKLKLASARGETVAGLSTRQVVVTDQAGNVVQRIFVEPKTGLLLKRQLFDAVGTQVGLFEFDSVDLTPNIDPSVFRLERRGAKIVRTTDLLKGIAAKAGFAFAYLKPGSGYHLDFSRVNSVEGQEVLMQFYSSAAGRVSLFQVKGNVSAAQLSKFSRGDVQVHSWKARGATFVLIGNQAQSELRRVAGHLTFGN